LTNSIWSWTSARFPGLSDKRKAHATNERNANAPSSVGEYKASHGPGCGCCSTRPSRLGKQTRSGAKSFPTGRPWMISH
jgi:hypothetical protein